MMQNTAENELCSSWRTPSIEEVARGISKMSPLEAQQAIRLLLGPADPESRRKARNKRKAARRR